MKIISKCEHFKIYGFLLLLILIFSYCSNSEINHKEEETSNQDSLIIGHGYDFIRNGKIERAEFDSILTLSDIDTFDIPPVTQKLATGLKNQLKLLSYQKSIQEDYSGIQIKKRALRQTIKILLSSQFDNSFGVKNKLNAYQIWGEDQKGNVHYTGYFTPILKVKAKPDNEYKYPLYRYPKDWEGLLPTRAEIDGEKVLAGKKLEIAYAKSMLDIYFMQVQGSGYVEFPNGKRKLLAHAGGNKHKYRSIGKYMVDNGYATPEYVSLKSIKSYFQKHPEKIDSILFINPSYVFFAPVNNQPRGAGNVTLTPNYSIAIDKKVLPLGSCFLAKIPIIDDKRNFSHHEFRILLAQDIGGAIKGTGHVDLYKGIGLKSQFEASALHHYGSLWLLLPKEKD